MVVLHNRVKLRTVEDTYMVGVVAKMDTIFIGTDQAKYIFTDLFGAKNYLESLGKDAKIEITPRDDN